jgi:aminobenzoyl-glutamate utilization protein B
VQLYADCQTNGSPGHSWQNVACGKSSLRNKGMLYAGKALAGLAIDLLTCPDLLAQAKEEHRKKSACGYVCPIPPDAVPTAL